MKILYQFAWPAQNLRLKFNLNESSKKYDNLEKEKVEIQTCFSKDFNYLYISDLNIYILPIQYTFQMKEEDKLAYYEEAMKKGLGGYLMPDQFTSIGKFKVKTPTYNSPVDMYSDQTMDDMICGSGNVE